jgi:hypothetical protein
MDGLSRCPWIPARSTTFTTSCFSLDLRPGGFRSGDRPRAQTLGRNGPFLQWPEFIQSTTPIFPKYVGPALLLDSARMRRQLSRQAAFQLFSTVFGTERLSVEESYQTYYDTLAGRWGWWTRIEGHFWQLLGDQKPMCYRAVKKALLKLEQEQGIPYTIHQLHVKLRNA